MDSENITLYKRAYNGDVLSWSVSLDTTDGVHYRLRYEYGAYNGKKAVSYSDYIEPKNLYKKNQTTSHQQALKELHSIVARQTKKGYKDIIDILSFHDYANLNVLDKNEVLMYLNAYLPKYNTDANNVCKPMKCQKFQIGKMKYPAIAQPKINGVRCIIMYSEVKEGEGLFESIHKQAIILSKEGLRYNVKHIEDDFTMFYEQHEEYRNIVFDGELYIKGIPVTTIGGAARNINNEYHKELKFVCFDLAIPDISNAKREDIRKDISNVIDCYCPKSAAEHRGFNTIEQNIIFLNSYIAITDEDVLEYRDVCIKVGYEGCVVRDSDAEYCFGQRPKTIMKCKTFDDSEFEVLDIKCRGNAYDKVGFTIIYLLKNDINDLQFECNGTGTVEDKVNIYNNKEDYIGKKATVKFYERTKNGLPFHANVIGIRDYE